MSQQDSAEPRVHPTAIVRGDVTLGPGVTIDAYCVIDGPVTIGAGTTVKAHTVIEGRTVIGEKCELGPHAAIGTPPQHRGYAGQETCLVLADRVVAREFTSLHRAFKPGLENATYVGPDVLLMACAHVGHDSRVGAGATLANSVHLGGHVTVGERAFIGGGTVVHQFSMVGRLSLIGGGEAVAKDVLPFGAVNDRRHKAYNLIGVRRAGLPPATIRALRAAFTRLAGDASPAKAAAALRQEFTDATLPEVREVVEFIEQSQRGVYGFTRGRRSGDDD